MEVLYHTLKLNEEREIMTEYKELELAVFDIESNGLLDSITKLWCICFCDMSDGRYYLYYDAPEISEFPKDGTLLDGVRHLAKFGTNVCHNSLNYDFHVLKRFYPREWTAVPSQSIDTLLRSKLQLHDRYMTKYKHGLEAWGEYFGVPKVKIVDWTQGVTHDMLDRIVEDVKINVLTYQYLEKERKSLLKMGIDMSEAYKIESEYKYRSTLQQIHGVQFDIDYAKDCVQELKGITKELESIIEPAMPMYYDIKSPKATWKDVATALEWNRVDLKTYGFTPKTFNTQYEERERKGVKKNYELKPTAKPTTKIFIKNGDYNKNVCNFFEIEPESAKTTRLVDGAYSKIAWAKPTLAQHEKVKEFLFTQGWIPTEYNTKKVDTDRGVKFVETSPKLTEDSYDSIEGELGKQIAQYNTYVHRLRFLDNPKDDEKGLLNVLYKNGRLPCGVNTFNTATGRSSHSKWVNAPSASALGGEQIRKCIIAPEGRVLVAEDMNSAQLSIASYYANNYEYFRAVVDGLEVDEDGKYLGEDGHTFNAKAFGLTSIEDWEGARLGTVSSAVMKAIGSQRKASKPCTFGVIFGCSGKKLGKMAGTSDAEGQSMKESFLANIGLDGVQRTLNKMKKDMKRGNGWYIEIPFGYYVYCTSDHKAINYLIQGTEAVCQKIAENYMQREVRKRKLDAFQIITYHDEVLWESSPEHADQVKQLLSDGYIYASEQLKLWHDTKSNYFGNRQFQINLSAGAMIGMNYSQIH